MPSPFPSRSRGFEVDDVTVTTEAGESTRRYAVLGHPIPGMEVRLNTDQPHATDVIGRDVGEIEIRGTSLMTGYVGEAPIDPQSGCPPAISAIFTDDGLVVCGRAKELITVAGRNVFPTEIERIAGQIDGVRDGCVVAIGTGEASARPVSSSPRSSRATTNPPPAAPWWRASRRSAVWCLPTWCS